MEHHGAMYVDYRRRVPMLIPRFRDSAGLHTRRIRIWPATLQVSRDASVGDSACEFNGLRVARHLHGCVVPSISRHSSRASDSGSAAPALSATSKTMFSMACRLLAASIWAGSCGSGTPSPR